MEYFLIVALLILETLYMYSHLYCLIFIRGLFINIREEIIQSLVHPDIYINGDVDRFYFYRRHFYLTPGLYHMLGAAQGHE